MPQHLKWRQNTQLDQPQEMNEDTPVTSAALKSAMKEEMAQKFKTFKQELIDCCATLSKMKLGGGGKTKIGKNLKLPQT